MKHYSPEQQLDMLKAQCKNIAPEIYKCQALYIQNIRRNLKKVVRDVVFSLYIDSIDFDNNSKVASQDLLQKNIDKLINKTNSLLTIEHLLDLSRQIEDDIKLKKEFAKNQFLNALDKAKNSRFKPEETSIELSLSPPIENSDSINNWMPNDISSFSLLPDESYENLSQVNYEDTDSYEKSISDKSSESSFDDKAPSVSNKTDHDIFRSIFLMAGEAISLGKIPKEKNQSLKSINTNIEGNNNSADENFLPDNPKALLKWTTSIDLALSRRLINLSHAVNIELLRSGIINTLLPINLLEAVVKGHIETLDSIPNQLKIRVPIQGGIGDESMDISCLLIRTSEFEFEQPILRRCRSLISHNRSILFKMVRQYRHWQERSITKEAQQKWWPNP